MDRLEEILTMLDYALDTKSKRHMVGGILMSVSLLFGRPSNYCCNIKNGG
jgi:hypothetical protein